MNILLATYSYHPYNYGGTEIYVSDLAKYLSSNGHQVIVIAGMPPLAFQEHKIFFEDEIFKSVEYFQNDIRVIGVVMKHTSTIDIYRKSSPKWESSWLALLQKINHNKFDVLHIHANTSVIGNSFIRGAKLHSTKIKTIASYHIPVSCVKGTLLFGNKMEMCEVKASTNICTSCFISDKKNLSLSISKMVVKLLPYLENEKLPSNLRLKYLVNEFINSFYLLDKEVDQWHVFSDQIREILLLNSVSANKIILIRHGVNSCFNLQNNSSIIERKGNEKTIFLYLGRFEKAKGFFTLLKAWSSFPESSKRILFIIGEKQNDNPELDKWLSLSSNRNDIVWFGKKQQKDVAEIMKTVHCTIIPSEWIEIGPLVFHESIAAGSDVIASDIGGCKELGEIYEKKSLLFRAGNEIDLKEKILKFKYSGESLKVQNQLCNYEAVLKCYNHLNMTDSLIN